MWDKLSFLVTLVCSYCMILMVKFNFSATIACMSFPQVTVNWQTAHQLLVVQSQFWTDFHRQKQFVGLIVLSLHHAEYLLLISLTITMPHLHFLCLQNAISSLQRPFSLSNSMHHHLHKNTKVETPSFCLQLAFQLFFPSVCDCRQWLIPASAIMSTHKTHTGMIIAVDQVWSGVNCAEI